MKIATCMYQGNLQVGQVSEDHHSIRFFQLTQAEHDAGALTLALNPSLPALSDTALPLSQVQLMAPIPDRKSTRLNSSHSQQSRMPSSA